MCFSTGSLLTRQIFRLGRRDARYHADAVRKLPDGLHLIGLGVDARPRILDLHPKKFRKVQAMHVGNVHDS